MGYIRRLLPFLTTLALLTPQPSQYNGVETFAGDQAVTSGLRLLGYRIIPFDIRLDASHNLLCRVGFLAVLAAIMRTSRRGILWLAPPCSSWVWMSRHSTGRNRGALGNQENENVVRQNHLVSRVCYLVALAWKRGLYFIIEQPSSSVMWEHPRLRKLLERINRKMGIHTANIHLGCFTLEQPKEVTLQGNAPHIQRLSRRMTTEERALMRDNGHRKPTATHWVSKDGKKRSRGSEDLKATQSYPTGFGCHHALAYIDEVPLVAPSDSQPGLCLSPSDTESDSSMSSADSCLGDFLAHDDSFFAAASSSSAELSREMQVRLRD